MSKHPYEVSDVTYDQVWWPILWICALRLTHPKRSHTVVNTRTHPEQWAAIYAAVPEEQLWVQCLAQGDLVGIEGGREHCTFTPPTYNPYCIWDMNSQPFDYKSDSLTIRLRPPLNMSLMLNVLSKCALTMMVKLSAQIEPF